MFQMLVQDESYRMSDYEANAFMPYLVQKVWSCMCQCRICNVHRSVSCTVRGVFGVEASKEETVILSTQGRSV